MSETETEYERLRRDRYGQGVEIDEFYDAGDSMIEDTCNCSCSGIGEEEYCTCWCHGA